MNLMVKAMQVSVGNPIKKLVLLKLADNSSDSGECWPSYQHIADQCEISKRSAMRYIDQLAKDGFLRVEKRKVSANHNLTNVYHLTINVSKNSSDTDSLGSDTQSPGSDTQSLGGSDTQSPRTSHSLEPVNEPIRKKQKNSSSQIQKPTNVSQQVWKDFLSQRKTKLTETALKGIITQAEKAGWSLEQALTESIERGWQSFKAEWVIPKQNGFNQQPQKQSIQSQIKQAGIRILNAGVNSHV
jgi:DNA-binding transcriptional regulator YhcF (GntR family)